MKRFVHAASFYGLILWSIVRLIDITYAMFLLQKTSKESGLEEMAPGFTTLASPWVPWMGFVAWAPIAVILAVIMLATKSTVSSESEPH